MDKTDWDGSERRSGLERRSGKDRREDFERRQRLLAMEGSENADPQVIPATRWDRRSGFDRRGHRLYALRSRSE